MGLSTSPYRQRVLSDGASHYWPLTETTGSTAADLVGGAPGTISGGVTLGAPGPPEPPLPTKAYLQARSGIARSDAIRSNYVFPLFGVLTINGVDVTAYIQYGSLRVSQQLNAEPDTASFDVRLTDAAIEARTVVGNHVVIGLGGPSENVLFGGRILTTQTTRGPARTASTRSVFCADWLQILDSEYLITYNWPAQSATTTVQDLLARFFGKVGGESISPAAVQPGLPSHPAVTVINERFSTVLRRLVTMFPTGGGFYIDPLRVLHVWAGASEPNVVNPQPLTLENPTLKAFAETVDGAQQRDAVLVEGRRTTAPIGSPGPDPTYPDGIFSLPVLDASLITPDPPSGIPHEVRIGAQRIAFLRAEGVWSAPAGTPQTTIVTADVAFNPDAGVESNEVTLLLESGALFTGRSMPWIRIDEQYLKVVFIGTIPGPSIRVPRTGFGAMTGEIHANAVVTVVDSLAQGSLTHRYDAPGSAEPVRPQPIESDVVMTVRSETAYAVHEHLVQDGRYARTGAGNRGTQELADFAAPLTLVDFETDDLNARPGRLQAYTLETPPLAPVTGSYMILSAEITWPVWGERPRLRCRAADVLAESVVDTWLSDPR